MGMDRIRKSGVRWGLSLTLAGVSVLAFWPHDNSWAGGGQDLGTPPEDCIDQPTTTLPNTRLGDGGPAPGHSGGSYQGDPVASGDGPCRAGSDLAHFGDDVWLTYVGEDGDCGKDDVNANSGQPNYSVGELTFRDCDDGYSLAMVPTSRMVDGNGDAMTHEGTGGMTWFTLWDPYIKKTGSGTDTEYRVVLGPDLVYGFDDQLAPLCAESDIDGVTLDDGATDLLTLTLRRGVSTVRYEFHDFTQTAKIQGQFAAYQTDKSRFDASAHSGGNITQITRKPYNNGVLGSETERINIGDYSAQNYRGYTYHEYKDGSDWVPTRRTDYTYDGTTGDLDAVTYRAGYDDQGNPVNNPASDEANWGNEVGKMVFRYFDDGDDNDRRLKMVLDTEAVASAEAAGLDTDTATDPQLAAHATRAYTYHGGSGATAWKNGMVASVKGEGCGGCGSASSELSVTWAQNANAPTTGANRYKYWWRRSTEEMKDDNGDVYRRTTKYINRAGLRLCEITESRSSVYGAGGGNLEHVSIMFYEYEYDATDKIGRLVKVYERSAIEDYPKQVGKDEVNLTTLDGHDDLLDDTSGIELYDDQGVVRVTEYWGATTATTAARGGVDGYVRYHKVQSGKNGTTHSVTLDETLYIKHSYNSEDVYQVAEVKRFLEGTGEWASTVWEYTWHTDSNDIETVKRYRFVDENDNDPDTDDALETTVVRSEEGRDLWRKDERGLITYYLRDSSTQIQTGMIIDVETDHPDLSGVSIPAGFANADGTHRRTDIEKDKYNRVVKVTGPETSADTDGAGGMDETVRPVQWTVYVDGEYVSGGGGDWKGNEVRTASGYLEGVAYHLVGGISVRITERGEDANGVHRSERYVTERVSTASGELTSTEDIATRSRWSGWARTKTVNGQATERVVYHDIDGAGVTDPDTDGHDGTNGTHYLKTTTAYHPDGSVKYTEAPSGLRGYTFRDKKTVGGEDVWETRRYSVYDESGWKLAGPISVSWSNHDGETVRSFAATTSAGLYGAVDTTGGVPDGTDTLTALSRTKTTYDWRHRTSERWSYFDLGSLTEAQDGTEGTHYVVFETKARDDQGRVLYTRDPSGNFTATVTDALGRTIETWMGTSLHVAYDRNDPGSGLSNLAMVSRSFFDSDGDGTGTPTADLIRAERLKPNLTANVQDDTLTGEYTGTTFVYDLFGRRTHTKPDVGPWSRMTYSDAGAATESIAYKNDQNPDLAANLLAKSETIYDGANRVTESRTYEVNIGTGSTGKYIKTSSFYNDLGQAYRTENAQGAGSYTEWDDGLRAVRQVTFKSYSVDGSGAFNGVAVTETVTKYLTSGDGAGLAYLSTTYQRDHHVGSSTTGLLSGSIDSQDTYTAMWYDPAGRVTHSAYYGNNGGTAITGTGSNFDPDGSMTYANGPLEPDSSANVIVSKTEHNDRGQAYLLTANDDVQTRLYFDDAPGSGNRTHVVENYKPDGAFWDTSAEDPDNPASRSAANADVNRITKYVYDYALGVVKEQIAVDPDHDGDTGDNQVTKYVYSTGGVASGTPAGGLQSKSLLRAIIYPDSDDTTALGNGTDNTYDRVEFTYYSDGTLRTRKDQREVELTNVYHDDGALQYQDNNSASVAGVDSKVQSIGYTYDDLRRTTKITQYDEPSTKTGGLQASDIVNEVANAYTHLGRLNTQHQEHDGQATVSGGSQSLHVDYDYDVSTTGNVLTKDARITRMTYPGGVSGTSASIQFGYGSDGDITHELGVLSLIEDDDGTDLLSYQYFGVSGLAEARFEDTDGDGRDIYLEFHDDDDDGNYEGYDRFYRTTRIKWDKDVSGTRAEIHYGYDAVGRRVYHEDVKAAASSKAYDQLDTRNAFGELTKWEFGDVNTSTKAMTTRSEGRKWGLDQVGNWDSYDIDEDGNDTYKESGEFTQTRTLDNDANEIGTIAGTNGGNYAEPAYDDAGSMTTIPQPNSPANTYTATYDAWNRPVLLVDGSDIVANYVYDGLNRRIRKDIFSGTTLDHSDHFFYSGWQVIEVRRDSDSDTTIDPDANPVEQLIYHPYYIDATAIRYYDSDLSDNTQAMQYLYHDAQYNVVMLTNPAGTGLERYWYTSYGEQIVMNSSFVVKSGGTDYEQYKGFTGQYYDDESGLWYFKNRYYSDRLGQFISADKLGYVDGMNLRAGWFAMSSQMDPMGLARRENIESNRVLYTCNCGWIDFGHAMSMARQVFDRMRNAERDSIRSYSRPGYKVRIDWSLARIFHGGAEYYVYEHELNSSSVALSIFRDASVKNELWQRNGGNHALFARARNSSFSEEDLPSNLTSFYRVKDGLSRQNIEDYCGALTKKQSLAVWDEGGHTNTGRDESVTPWTYRTYWEPVYKTDKSKTAKRCCKNSPKEWPWSLRYVQDRRKGFAAWDNWVYYDIYFNHQDLGPNVAPRGTDQIRDMRNLPGHL